MNSVKINECIFNKILVALKGNLSKDWQRPTLKFIRLDVKKDKIIGYSVDGYTAGRIIIPCVKPNPDEFTAYIKPIPFKETPRGIEDVVISVDNGLASVEIMQEEKQCYTFKMPESFGVNIEKIWKDEDYADEEISVNALWLAKSLKTLSATHYDPQHRAVIKIKKNKTKPIIASAMCEDIQIDQLILPIRNMKEVNVEEKVSREKELACLIEENPTLPTVFMVDSEISECYQGSWNQGRLVSAYVDEYITIDIGYEKKIFTRDEQEELEEMYAEQMCVDLDNAKIQEIAHSEVEALPWVKAIIVKVGVPEE